MATMVWVCSIESVEIKHLSKSYFFADELHFSFSFDSEPYSSAVENDQSITTSPQHNSFQRIYNYPPSLDKELKMMNEIISMKLSKRDLSFKVLNARNGLIGSEFQALHVILNALV